MRQFHTSRNPADNHRKDPQEDARRSKEQLVYLKRLRRMTSASTTAIEAFWAGACRKRSKASPIQCPVRRLGRVITKATAMVLAADAKGVAAADFIITCSASFHISAEPRS